jgi:hypothetical protein
MQIEGYTGIAEQAARRLALHIQQSLIHIKVDA